MKMPSRLLLVLASALFLPCALADVKLPAIISDHMVLEKSARVPIWGKADPGEQVTVTLNDQAAKATANAEGRWAANLDLKASAPGPFEMTVEGKNKLVLSDVVVGEVWVASGQSNMEWILGNSIGAAEEIAGSANPLLRQFVVKKNPAPEPLDDAEGQWVSASPQTAGSFTAVGYFFAKKLQNELKVPVGLIHTSWGGTPSEAWTSPAAIGSNPDLKASSDRLWAETKAYPEKKKAFVDGLSTWIKENAREDAPSADPNAHAGLEVSTEGWVPVKLPGLVQAPGLPEAGVIWLRKEVTLPKASANVPMSLPIDGYDSIYWNGKLLKQTTYQEFPGPGYVRRYGPYNIPPAEVKEGKNILAIRLYEPVSPAKFGGVPTV